MTANIKDFQATPELTMEPNSLSLSLGLYRKKEPKRYSMKEEVSVDQFKSMNLC